MHSLVAGIVGLIFGIGLIVSGMTDPSKVQSFLDLTGAWNPSLALVMGGAIAVGLLAFSWARRRSHSLLGASMRLPTSRDIDRRLVGGSVLFGIGWGLAGYCPGPALASLATGEVKPMLFVLAMLVGMGLFELIDQRMATPDVPATNPAPLTPEK